MSINPGLAWYIAELTRTHRVLAQGGLWGIFAARGGEHLAVNLVYSESDTRRLARGTDAEIREVFTHAINQARREQGDIANEKLQALAASYGLRHDRHAWQTVVIERSAVVYGWRAPNGIDDAVGETDMDALGFLSLAIPELLADIVHGPGRGETA
jgi:hypothetical protein